MPQKCKIACRIHYLSLSLQTKALNMKYLDRIVDRMLQLRLEAFGAVQIVGPKWCGKTTTAMQQSKSVIKMQDPDKREGYLATARTKPSLLLRGETPRLIDEWQVAPGCRSKYRR